MSIPTRAPQPRTQNLVERLRRHQLGVYFGLTFAISWTIWLGLVMAALGIRKTQGAVLNVVVAIVGPSIAALILAVALGRGQLKELLAGLSVSSLLNVLITWAVAVLVAVRLGRASLASAAPVRLATTP